MKSEKTNDTPIPAAGLVWGGIALLLVAILYQWMGTGWPWGWWAYILRGMLIAGIFATGSAAFGFVILTRIFGNTERIPSLPESLALGIYIHGLVLLVAGEFQLLSSAVALLMLFADIIAVIVLFRSSIGTIRPNFRLPDHLISLFPLALILLPILLFQFVPSQYYDTLEYHLGGPIAWAQNGNTHPLRGNFYTGLPSFYEYIYTWGILLAHQTPVLQAKLLHIAGKIFFFLAVSRLFANAGLEKRYHLFGLALLVAMPGFFQSGYDANNDLIAGGLVALALAELFQTKNRLMYLSGFYLGAAMAVKFNVLTIGLASVFAALLLILLVNLIQASKKIKWLHVALIPILFIIVIAPVLLRAYQHYGFPLFPLTILGSPKDPLLWSATQAEIYAVYHYQAWPWTGIYWDRWGAQIVRMGSLPLTMLALAFIGLTFSLRRDRHNIAILLAAYAGGLAAWNLLGNSPTRFLLLIQPCAVGAALLAWQHLIKKLSTILAERKGRFFQALLIPTLFILPTAFIYWGEVDRYDIILAGIHDDPAARRAIASPPGWEESGLNAALDALLDDETADPYIFCLYEARVAAVPFRAETVTVHDALPLEWSSLDGLRTAGFTHILVNEAELERLRDFYPPDRLRGGRGRSPLSTHQTPGTADFYADWGPAFLYWIVTSQSELPRLFTEIAELRDKLSDKLFPSITASGHRIWLAEIN